MLEKIRPSWAEIDLNSLANNIREVKRVSKGKDVIVAIKADGYGHGAAEIYEVMVDNGVSRLAVAIIEEAIELRRAGAKLPIMILGFTPSESYKEVIDYQIEQTIFSYEEAKCLSEEAVKKNTIAKIHIAVDTGMGRIGFLPTREQAEEVHRITELKGIEIVGMFTHFATADEIDKKYTKFQVQRFDDFNRFLEEFGVIITFKHVSNSAAIIDFPNLEYQGVRAGIMSYGYYPSQDVDKSKVNLIPIMTLKSKIVHLKTIGVGESVSYGRVFKATRKSVIATLPIGYGDGFARLLTGKAKVIINGVMAPIVGRICMDQCMVDVTDVPEVKVGDEVILMGRDDKGNSITADDIGRATGTISYEVLCNISKRIPRIYTKNGKICKVKSYIGQKP